MADIGLFVTDHEDEQDEDELDVASDENSMLGKEIPDEFVSPLAKMERHLNSEIIFNRRMAARCVLECLRSVKSDEECYQVLQLMVRLSDDIEAAVRIEVMEQIPHVAVLCVEHRGLHFSIPQYILPIVVRYLTDPNNQVRKTSQAALLLLLEQEVIERVDIEQQICPVLIELCNIESTDDFRTEAVTLMSKMAPMVGKEITERYFLGQFDSLCSDPLFHVRKVCAANFGEMCEVIGNELTERRLLPIFEKLCQDGVWGVRKACAECFMSVSTVTSKEVRRSKLAPLFINLLGDKSRWVQMAAYQSLGPFISTFADPYNSGFFVDEQGKLCKFDIPAKAEAEISSDGAVGLESDEKKSPENNCIDVKTTDSGYMSPPEAHLDPELQENRPIETVTSQISELNITQKSPSRESELESYNSFNYWRFPLPEIPDETSGVSSREGTITNDPNSSTKNSSDQKDTPCEKSTTDPNEETKLSEDGDSSRNTSDQSTIDNRSDEEEKTDEQTSEEGKTTPRLEFQDLGISDMDIEDCDDNEKSEKDLICHETTEDSPKRMQPLSGVANLRFDEDSYLQPYSPNMCFDDEASSPPLSPRHDQMVIPQALLDHYISMTEPSKAQAIDTDLAKHCAFSFPAVALTLGAKNWRCLRDTYELLASDMQWKVRRTLAFSIHELSQILGKENTRVDLVPIFNNFLKDLDEVRIGVLKHLAKFIKLLAPDLRSAYLPTFSEFLTTDNVRNWRFRYELAEQLIMLADVYQPSEVNDHICPIALTLGADRVAEVRLISYKLFGILLLKLNTDSDFELRKKFTEDIMEHFASSMEWLRRLSYCQLCEVLLEEDFITAEKFAVNFLPHLLTYQHDKIANVKLALSRTLTRAVMVTDYFCRPECKDSEKVLEAIERLQSDSDRDVRYFAGHDEEIPYEGRRYSDDQTYMVRTTSRESFEDEITGHSPLDSEFAEEQIEAKLMGVETTDRAVTVEVYGDEGFEEENQSPSDEENEEHPEETGDESVANELLGEESKVNDQNAGDELAESFEENEVKTGDEHGTGDEENVSCSVEEKETEDKVTADAMTEGKSDDDGDKSKEQEETQVENEG